ncbi:MAG: indolepyruvate oxidoreductase subunit beta [Planctomycetota bacterium]
MTDRPVTSVFLAGVGGQGIVMASRILAELAFSAGFDVKQNEVHGLSQRAGSVTGHVRWGTRVFTPVIMDGEADFLLALEELEGLRWAHIVRPGGMIILNRHRIVPPAVTVGGETYPENAAERLAEYGRVVSVPATAVAAEAGNAGAANIVILGAMSAHTPGFTPDRWKAAITTSVPAGRLAGNLTAFDRGRDAGNR